MDLAHQLQSLPHKTDVHHVVYLQLTWSHYSSQPQTTPEKHPPPLQFAIKLQRAITKNFSRLWVKHACSLLTASGISRTLVTLLRGTWYKVIILHQPTAWQRGRSLQEWPSAVSAPHHSLMDPSVATSGCAFSPAKPPSMAPLSTFSTRGAYTAQLSPHRMYWTNTLNISFFSTIYNFINLDPAPAPFQK